MDAAFAIGLIIGEAAVIAIGLIGFGRLRQQYPDEKRLATLQAVTIPFVTVLYAVALVAFRGSGG